MGTPKVQSLIAEIEALSEAQRQELAHEVLPLLLTTRAGLEHIDESLRELSDDELRTLVERARRRASDLSEDEVAAIIAEGLRAARAQGRT
jgi:tRNA(Ser,Leu) C12 N-acetylase TAN1